MPSPLVALLNLFKVYCILIDAHQCVLFVTDLAAVLVICTHWAYVKL